MYFTTESVCLESQGQKELSMATDLQNPAFTDEDKTRGAFEAVGWPNGSLYPHCRNSDPEKIARGERFR
jgi:hypothetical protein